MAEIVINDSVHKKLQIENIQEGECSTFPDKQLFQTGSFIEYTDPSGEDRRQIVPDERPRLAGNQELGGVACLESVFADLSFSNGSLV